ncbi:hypothetical protein [Streptomyces sp. NPDC002215]|uniref:hypothetical protein n=1 Tax=Streptomyces sp. NPDC002215 TaxID=3154412 RepID=UPI0033340095
MQHPPNSRTQTRTIEITLPAGFRTWFDGTALAQGQDDIDPQCKALRLAYEAGQVNADSGITLIATADVLNLLEEYAGYCTEASVDLVEDDKGAQNELEGAEALARQVHAARTAMKACTRL